MRIRLTAIIAVLAAFVSSAFSQQPSTPHPTPAASQDGISVYYSPKGGCTAAVVEQIGNARKSIELQAYSFTSGPIAEALLSAHKRGVKVTAVLDKSQRGEAYSSATFLLNQGMPTYIDSAHAIAHNKIILIDGQTIITGSFDFTKAAEESNAENLLVIEGKADLYRAYEKNFQEHLAHSIAYTGPSGPEKTPQPTGGAPAAANPAPTPAAVPASGAITLRGGITPTAAEEALAKRIKAAGWEYTMPRPKSAKAAWGNSDGRTTWYYGYWKNTATGAYSSTEPKESDSFHGDGVIQTGWRRGGSPGTPSRIEWLCSTSGGIPPR